MTRREFLSTVALAAAVPMPRPPTARPWLSRELIDTAIIRAAVPGPILFAHDPAKAIWRAPQVWSLTSGDCLSVSHRIGEDGRAVVDVAAWIVPKAVNP